MSHKVIILSEDFLNLFGGGMQCRPATNFNS